MLIGGVDYGMSENRAQSDGADAWKPLTGSREEIEGLREILSERGSEVRMLTGQSATKSAVVSSLPTANLIHVSTHGFLEPAAKRTEANAVRRNPLLATGLVLSGANRWDQSETAPTGLITAEELICLDLSHADLVTLASCSSGRGKSINGEGVFGLQRAIHLGGALTTVASSWNVSDSATKAIMVEFYRNRSERKQSKVEALRNAQLAMLRGKLAFEGRPSKGKRVSPYHWAAWALSGRWQD